VTPEINEHVEKWGITVEQVSFPDLGEIKTYRIMSDSNKDFGTTILSNPQD
jgi:hypothetical protein